MEFSVGLFDDESKFESVMNGEGFGLLPAPEINDKGETSSAAVAVDSR